MLNMFLSIISYFFSFLPQAIILALTINFLSFTTVFFLLREIHKHRILYSFFILGCILLFAFPYPAKFVIVREILDVNILSLSLALIIHWMPIYIFFYALILSTIQINTLNYFLDGLGLNRKKIFWKVVAANLNLLVPFTIFNAIAILFMDKSMAVGGYPDLKGALTSIQPQLNSDGDILIYLLYIGVLLIPFIIFLILFFVLVYIFRLKFLKIQFGMYNVAELNLPLIHPEAIINRIINLFRIYGTAVFITTIPWVFLFLLLIVILVIAVNSIEISLWEPISYTYIKESFFISVYTIGILFAWAFIFEYAKPVFNIIFILILMLTALIPSDVTSFLIFNLINNINVDLISENKRLFSVYISIIITYGVFAFFILSKPLEEIRDIFLLLKSYSISLIELIIKSLSFISSILIFSILLIFIFIVNDAYIFENIGLIDSESTVPATELKNSLARGSIENISNPAFNIFLLNLLALIILFALSGILKTLWKNYLQDMYFELLGMFINLLKFIQRKNW